MAAGTGRRDYFELLEVSEECTPSELKKAYRKAALRHHPDKNHDTDTTELFRQINDAYTCLSDPSERAYYLRHRDAILRGFDPEDVSQETDTELNLWKYFSSSCFTNLSTGPKGFYTVYAFVFSTLTREEETAAATQSLKVSLPQFGGPDSSPEDVNAFYSYWDSFSSVKLFGFADVYDEHAHCGEARRVRRYVEQENKHARDKERKAFNDRVRHVVAFARRHDPRWAAIRREADKAREDRSNELQARREARAAQRAAARERLAAALAEEGELSLSESELVGFADEDDESAVMATQAMCAEEFEAANATDAAGESGDEASDEELEPCLELVEDKVRCVVCDRTYRTIGAARAHVTSKGHAAAVERLKASLLAEEADAMADSPAPSVPVSEAGSSGGGRSTKGSKKARRRQARSDIAAVEDVESPPANTPIATADDDDWAVGPRKSKKRAQRARASVGDDAAAPAPPAAPEATAADSDSDDWAVGPKKSKKKSKKKASAPSDGTSPAADAASPTDPPSGAMSKKEKKAAKKAAAGRCRTCGMAFESNSKLHAHLEATGHGRAR
jgi:DnaJ family protein A protein 5